MVTLNRIYTRTGDDGTTALATGGRLHKHHIRVSSYGTVDETNASIGIARLHTAGEAPELDEVLGRIQNDLFDLGADLATPDTGEKLEYEPLRIIQAQVDMIEREIDRFNRDLEPLRSFILPGGTPGSSHLHLSRTICRRAERLLVELSQIEGEKVGGPAIKYMNRLSDFLFVASRYLNAKASGDILWVPGANR